MANHRPYSLVDYDPDWVDRFAYHSRKIQRVLGPVVVDVYHIGSTSIPGMMAKPNIDIEVAVSSLDNVRELSHKMMEAGYTPRGDYSKIGEEYFTEDAKDGERLTSVHVLPVGHPDIQMQLNFRDYLRTHAKDRELYRETKNRPFSEYRNDYGSYDSGKREVIKAIKGRAELWAKNR